MNLEMLTQSLVQNSVYVAIGTILMLLLPFSIKIIRPTHRGVIEFLGKYARFSQPGLSLIIPIIESIHRIDVTESLVDVAPQDIITKDNLNAKVDLMVYYKVRADEESIKKSIYNVADFSRQIVSLAQTTARNVIGGMEFADVNSKRNILNQQLTEILDKETDAWGVAIVRVELKEITPPADVQITMNNVIKAENTKDAAIDFATAKETEADGLRRALIKEAEGKRQARILEAEGIKQSKILIAQGDAEAIKVVNEAAERYFKGNAQELKRLETVEGAMSQNSKYIISSDLVEKVSKVLNGGGGR